MSSTGTYQCVIGSRKRRYEVPVCCQNNVRFFCTFVYAVTGLSCWPLVKNACMYTRNPFAVRLEFSFGGGLCVFVFFLLPVLASGVYIFASGTSALKSAVVHTPPIRPEWRVACYFVCYIPGYTVRSSDL